MPGKVFLLTGAPGTGKTTAANLLVENIRPLKRVDFGRVLLEHRQRRSAAKLSRAAIRKKSAELISHKDVAAMDDWFARKVQTWHLTQNILLDSHAVTKEAFGFRVTPYNLAQLEKISFDAILVMHCEPKELVRRIKSRPGGRRVPTVHEAAQHQYLQESLALTYGVASGCPCFVIDTTKNKARRLLETLLKILEYVGTPFTTSSAPPGKGKKTRGRSLPIIPTSAGLNAKLNGRFTYTNPSNPSPKPSSSSAPV